jgi:ligand-binding sensor domain-containing protein
MNRITALWACLLILSSAIAQEPRFIKHDTGDANEGSPIYTLIQDLQCMLWLGTANGLARYDGNTLHPIALTNADTAIIVTALFEDKDQRIWIGTSSGDIYFMDRTRVVHLFEPEEGLPRKTITSIIQDPQGFIWFATYGEGVYVYTGSRLYNMGMDDGLNGQDIYDMVVTSTGDIWLGTDDGINICTFKNETKNIRSLGLKDGLPDQIITSLKADRKGNVWIGTFEYGVVYFDALSGKMTRPFGQTIRDEITSFTIFDDSEVWVGTRSSGVWRYSPEMSFPRKIVNLNTFKLGKVTAMLDDVEGNIWIVTEEGLLLSAFRPFESMELNIPDIQSLFCDSADRLWIGSKSGLYRIKENPAAYTDIIRVLPDLNLNVTDIIEDPFHNIWIGTLDHGLYIHNPADNRVKNVGSIIKKGGITIMSMATTKKEIWLATLEGVVFYPADKNIMLENQPAFSLVSDPWQSNLHFVFQVFVDSKERTWFATDGNGVFYMDGREVVQLTGNDSLQIETVYSICEDHRGHLWFNTPDLGLIEYDGAGYVPLHVEQGLGNINLASIITAGTGDIIITHNRGIDLMEPDRRHFMYYDDEIAINDFEPGLNSVTHDSQGHIYTSGKNVIIKYYATKSKLSIHPRTQLTEVSVFDVPVDFANKHRFRAAENYISFDYVGLWYTSPASVKYQYKLQGYDLQWKESRDNVASYSSLAPGNYTFFVKASENNFFLDEPIAAYSFTIEKPFWKKIWFLALMATFSAGAIYWLVKSREKRFERQALLKKGMIESQLSALKAQINPHFLFNSFNTLITIIDENARNPDVAIEYVEKLSDFYRSILQYREQESISLQEEWELVRNFVYLLEKRYGNNLRLHMTEPPADAYILPLTLQMLVENAVKHNVISEKYPLDLYISADEDEYVTVKNNLQPKSRTEPSTQFGLQSILKRYQLLSDKKVIIEKNKDTFRVRIPIIKKAGI